MNKVEDIKKSATEISKSARGYGKIALDKMSTAAEGAANRLKNANFSLVDYSYIAGIIAISAYFIAALGWVIGFRFLELRGFETSAISIATVIILIGLEYVLKAWKAVRAEKASKIDAADSEQ